MTHRPAGTLQLRTPLWTRAVRSTAEDGSSRTGGAPGVAYVVAATGTPVSVWSTVLAATTATSLCWRAPFSSTSGTGPAYVVGPTVSTAEETISCMESSLAKSST